MAPEHEPKMIILSLRLRLHNTDKWQHNDNYINDVAQVNKIFANTAYIKEVFRIRVFKSGYGFGNFFSSSWIRIQIEKKTETDSMKNSPKIVRLNNIEHTKHFSILEQVPPKLNKSIKIRPY